MGFNLIDMHQLPKTLPAFFLHFIKQQPVMFAIFFSAPLLLIIEITVMPYILKIIVDTIVQSRDSSQLTAALMPIVTMMLSLWFMLIVGIRVQNHLQSIAIPKFEENIRMSVFQYMVKHSFAYFSDNLSGKLASKVNDLPKALDSMRMILCWNVIMPFATSIVTLAIIATINVKLATIMLGWLIIHISFSLYLAPSLNQVTVNNAQHRSQLAGVIVDIFANIVSTKLFSHEGNEITYLHDKQQVEHESNRKMIAAMNYYRLVVDLLIFILMATMMLTLVNVWQTQAISTGDFVFVFNAMFATVNQMWWFGTNLPDLLRHAGTAKQALSIINDAHDITDAEDAVALRVTEGKIELDNISFGYDSNRKLFQSKSLIIQPQQHVGLVGFSGGGKTSFVNLILRLYEVNTGRILIDGQDIKKVTQTSLRAQIAMIPQDISLFHRTIMENIRYGNSEASDDEVIAAAKLAHCDEFINELPDGYHTLVGERGIKLSGGQRQRIAIARAMLKDAPILILDEATSALDSITEDAIQDSLVKLMVNRTTIVVAHRLSTLAKMDRILVFENGEIIEDGTHQALIAAKGHYAKLWEMQVGGFIPQKRV